MFYILLLVKQTRSKGKLNKILQLITKSDDLLSTIYIHDFYMTIFIFQVMIRLPVGRPICGELNDCIHIRRRVSSVVEHSSANLNPWFDSGPSLIPGSWIMMTYVSSILLLEWSTTSQRLWVYRIYVPYEQKDPRSLFEKRRGQPQEFWSLVSTMDGITRNTPGLCGRTAMLNIK